MKYELIISCQAGVVNPEYVPGMDRLSWYSPYPGMREFMEERIAAGDLSRYVEHDDRTEEIGDESILHVIYNTLEGATLNRDLVQDLPVVNSAIIIERPDL